MPFVYAGIAAVVIAIVIYCVPPIPYFLARAAGIRDLTASMFIVMRLRKVPPGAIVMPLIIATKAGVEITAIQLMTHYVAGGDVESVVLKLIAANKSGKTTTFVEAAAADLAKNSKLRGKPFDFKRISPINAYISAVAAGVSVTPGEIIGMMRSGIALGENVKRTASTQGNTRYPDTRMGVEEVQMDAFSRGGHFAGIRREPRGRLFRQRGRGGAVDSGNRHPGGSQDRSSSIQTPNYKDR